MSNFQSPTPLDPLAEFAGDAMGHPGEPIQDPNAPLDLELLPLQVDSPMPRASFAPPQEQMESPLVIETQPAAFIEAGDLRLLNSVVGAAADGGAGLMPTSNAISASVGEGLLGLNQGFETGPAQTSFSLGEMAEGLRIDYSPPPEVQVRAGEDEKPPTTANAPFQDEGWFAELRDSNRFRPGSEPSAPENHGRTYGQPRLSSVARPRVGGRSFNPFRRRASAQRCRRCGARLFLGSRCEQCGTDYCSYCSEALENGRCSNESCATAARDRCQSCGMEVCQCGV